MKIGAVSYLNTKPLIDYWQSDGNDEMVLDLPSRLADQLLAGSIDVGLIPAVEVFRQPEFVIVPNACIACEGPVWSVKLISRVPMHEIRTLSLDEGSRTSAILSQVLLHHLCDVRPDKSPLPIDQDWWTVATDAAVVIGDRAMNAESEEFPYQWDLGEQWNLWTGMPFVFAVWATRQEIADNQSEHLCRLQAALNESRDEGVRNLPAIARLHADSYGLTFESCLKYLSYYLHFNFGERQRQAVNHFHRLAMELDFAPEQRELTYHEC